MALKKYTLYFKGKNEKGKEINIPIVSLELKKMDEFTTNYNNSYELFEDLPKAVKKILKEEFCYDIDFTFCYISFEHLTRSSTRRIFR